MPGGGWLHKLGDAVVRTTGSPEGTPAAEIERLWVAGNQAARAGDADGMAVTVRQLVQVAKDAGFTEVVAAVDRAAWAELTKVESPEVANKAVTLAVYSLKYRPQPGTPQALVLDAWARVDLAGRSNDMDRELPEATHALLAAAKSAHASQVVEAYDLLGRVLMSPVRDQALNNRAWGALALEVYRFAYRREPPSYESFG